MKTSTVLLIAAGVGLVALVAHEAGAIPNGYGSTLMVPGAFTMTAPAGGNMAFVLPSGASWVQAARASAAGVAQVPIQVPSGRAPLLAQVAPGEAWMFQWRDASGVVQTTANVFQ